MLGNGAIALGDSFPLLPWHLKVTSTSRTNVALVRLYNLARGRAKRPGEML